MPLTRSDIVAAALHTLDTAGLPDLTMRRVANELSVAPGALYWHIPNKQSLLAALSDEILRDPRLAEAAGKPQRPWDRRLTDFGFAFRGTLLAHRDGAEVVSAAMASGLGRTDVHRWIIEIVADGGFSIPAATTAAVTLTHFVVGFTFEEQTRALMESVGAATGSSIDRGPQFAAAIALLIAGVSGLPR